MVIRDLSNVEIMDFGRLEVPSIFKWDDRIFMKISNNYDDNDYNTYDFSKSRLTKFDKFGEVEYYPSELIIHEKGWKNND